MNQVLLRGREEIPIQERNSELWNRIYGRLMRHRRLHNLYLRLDWLKMLFVWQIGYRLRRRVRWLLPSVRRAAKAKYLVIRINHFGAGFFAYLTFALNQLKYAEHHGYRTVVDFGLDAVNGPNAYIDLEYGENLWDYFFEPVDGYTFAQLRSMIEDPESPLTVDDVTTLGVNDLWFMHQHDPSSIYGYPYGFYRYKTRFDEAWFTRHRREAHRVIQQYVALKPHVVEAVDEFYEQYMAGRPIIGIHVRGTDKGDAGCMPALRDIVPPEEYVPEIDRFRREHPGSRIFVATDQTQYMEFMRDHYGDDVICYDALRSSNEIPTFDIQLESNYRKGWDVLMDTLLLSRCDFLIKCSSHVGEAALWFNPELESIDLNYKRLEKPPRRA